MKFHSLPASLNCCLTAARDYQQTNHLMKIVLFACLLLIASAPLLAQVEMPMLSMVQQSPSDIERFEAEFEASADIQHQAETQLYRELDALQAEEAQLAAEVESLTRTMVQLTESGYEGQDWEDHQIALQAADQALTRAHLDLGNQRVKVQRKWQEITDIAYVSYVR